MFWLNGAAVPDKDINPFGLLGLLNKERATMSTLTSLGMAHKEALEVLTHPSVTQAQQVGALDGLFDASDRIEGGEVVIYWNDIEKDKRWALKKFLVFHCLHSWLRTVLDMRDGTNLYLLQVMLSFLPELLSTSSAASTTDLWWLAKYSI